MNTFMLMLIILLLLEIILVISIHILKIKSRDNSNIYNDIEHFTSSNTSNNSNNKKINFNIDKLKINDVVGIYDKKNDSDKEIILDIVDNIMNSQIKTINDVGNNYSN